jgi:hypothetical protein
MATAPARIRMSEQTDARIGRRMNVSTISGRAGEPGNRGTGELNQQ